MKVFIFLAGLLLSAVAADAAGTDPYTLLNKIQRVYSTNGFLKFNMRYQYASLAVPDKILDSLNGNVAIHGNHYYVMLDSIESMANDKFVYQAFPRESLIVVTNRPAAGQQNMALPTSVLDSVFIVKSKLKLSALEKGGFTYLTLTFPEGLLYKKVTLQTDNKTGYIMKSVFEVKTEALLDENAARQEALNGHAGGYDDYALVTVTYFDYNAAAFSDALFSNSRFVQQQNGLQVPAAAYTGYTIYNTNPK